MTQEDFPNPSRIPSRDHRPALIVVPYRGSAFLAAYGPVVRDWGFIAALLRDPVSHVFDTFIVERPRLPWGKSVPEALSAHGISASLIDSGRIFVPAALMVGRRCTERPTQRAIDRVAADYASGLLLDFDPFARLRAPEGWAHWIDEIDDFSVHHRLPLRDRRSALLKQAVPSDLRTISDASGARTHGATHLPNFPFGKFDSLEGDCDADAMEFGFLGFVADKTDIAFVSMLAEIGPVGIWGRAVDKSAEIKLRGIPGVHLFGEYRGEQVRGIMRKFRHGIIPFSVDRIHGNSPIKAFLYSAYAKRIISTHSFGLSLPNMLVCSAGDASVVRAFLDAPVDWAAVNRMLYRGREGLLAHARAFADALSVSRRPR